MVCFSLGLLLLLEMFFNIILVLCSLAIHPHPKTIFRPPKNEHKKVYKMYVDLLVLEGEREREREGENMSDICIYVSKKIQYKSMYWIKGWIWEFNVYVWVEYWKVRWPSHFTHWHFAVAGCWFWIQSNKIYTIFLLPKHKKKSKKTQNIFLLEWMIVNNFPPLPQK